MERCSATETRCAAALSWKTNAFVREAGAPAAAGLDRGDDERNVTVQVPRRVVLGVLVRDTLLGHDALLVRGGRVRGHVDKRDGRVNDDRGAVDEAHEGVIALLLGVGGLGRGHVPIFRGSR